MSTVISVENVSKSYRLGMVGGATLRADVSRWWAKLCGRPDPLQKIGEEARASQAGESFWALKNVSFEVAQGEVLGIIGRNGAGKSTLLKILSQVTNPTDGCIKLKGRVASLLEVGTGFHPELTGRENIFLNGVILGMTKAEIKRKFDEIVAFAEIEQFLDTPVKRYSSGMYVRLAFAVAAHLEPEILIVDEVLAVGDAEFQKKCLGKMNEVSRSGRTVLIVSHNFGMVAALCSRVVLLERGTIKAIGDPAEVLSQVASEGDSKQRGQYRLKDSDHSAPCIVAIKIPALEKSNAISSFDDVVFRVEIDGGTQPHLLLGLHVFNERQEQVIHSSSEFGVNGSLRGCTEFQITLPRGLLNVGRYECSFLLGVRNYRVFCELERVVSFEIKDARPSIALTRHADWKGTLSPHVVRWEIISEQTHGMPPQFNSVQS